MIAIILQMCFTWNAWTSDDITFDLGEYMLCVEFVQSLSIITACVPYLKPFYLGLGSGMMRSDDLRRHGMLGSYGYGRNGLFSSSRRTDGQQSSRTHTILGASTHLSEDNGITYEGELRSKPGSMNAGSGSSEHSRSVTMKQQPGA